MRDILKTIHLIVLGLWPLTAMAAGDSLGRAFTEHSIADWVAVALVSTVSGLVALLNRIRKNMEAEVLELSGQPFTKSDKLILNWRLFVVFHMSGSYGAGLVAFLIGGHFDLDNYLHALVIAFFAWAGATLLDKMAGQGSKAAIRMLNTSLGNKED